LSTKIRFCAAIVILGLFLTEVSASAQTPTATPTPENTYFTRPVPLGVSGGNYESYKQVPQGNTTYSGCEGGTLGVVVQDPKGAEFVTGCNHVMNLGANGSTSKNSPIVQPATAFTVPGCICCVGRSQLKSNEIAKLSAVVPLNTGANAKNEVDAAMAKITSGEVSNSLFFLGAFSSTVAAPAMNMTLEKVGSGSGYTTGTIEQVDVTVPNIPYPTRVGTQVSGQGFVYITLLDQIEVYPPSFAAMGDSGALAITGGGSCPQPVGIVVAGSSSYAFLDPISTVLTALAKADKQKSLSIVGSCQTPAEDIAQNESQNADIQAAEAVRHRHLADLMKIPDVVGVAIDLADSQIAFNVEVDKKENVAEVERSVPTKIEGYDVEVGPAPTGVVAY